MADTLSLSERIAETGAQALDLRFTDLLGGWRHLTIDAGSGAGAGVEQQAFFDGSSIPGWRDVHESDLTLQPDARRAWADPFSAQPTVLCIADVVDPATREGYQRCPRSALKRTLQVAEAQGVADVVHIGADLGFYLFERIDVQRSDHALGFDAVQIGGGTLRPKPSLYLAGQPQDRLADLRGEMMSVLNELGVVGLTHVLLRDDGQCELRFSAAEALRMADQLQLTRYVIDNVARAYGKVACFLPLPVPDAVGSGLHFHVALERGGRPLFAGQGYADLSDTCLHAIGGLLRHTRTLNAFTNPSTNSYRRLRRGRYEPALLGFGARNRSTAIRIPSAARPEDKRIELRFPDPLANPYLAIAGVVLAVADGIARAIDPGDPMDRNIYDLGIDDTTGLERCSKDLPSALNALEAATNELFGGGDVPAELIEAYVALKRAEVDLIGAQPHPMEHVVYGS